MCSIFAAFNVGFCLKLLYTIRQNSIAMTKLPSTITIIFPCSIKYARHYFNTSSPGTKIILKASYSVSSYWYLLVTTLTYEKRGFS